MRAYRPRTREPRSAAESLPCGFNQRADIVGTSVSDTTAEMRIVIASVTANSRNSRPTTSLMNSSGISTATSEIVSEMIVNPICVAPFSAAAIGGSPSST